MKSLKIILAVLGTVCIISGIGFALTGPIWSNEVDVEVTDYSLTLSVDSTKGAVNSTFTFTGTLSTDGTSISGATITLFKDDVSTGLTDITDLNGDYSIAWSTSVKGNYTFKTKAEW